MTVSQLSIESSNRDSDVFRMRDEDDGGTRNFLTGSIQMQDEEVLSP
jgi:hypothetical protein